VIHLAKLEFLDHAERLDYSRLLGILKREWGLDRPEEVVLRALREAAERQ
jgi:hypothetical protein